MARTDWEALVAGKPKRAKYRNVRTEVDGKRFDSKLEAARYLDLKLMEAAGIIHELRCQVPFELVPAVRIGGKAVRAMRYTCDFCYTQDGRQIVEDVKGVRTRDYLMRRHLMKFVHNIEIVEVGR